MSRYEEYKKKALKNPDVKREYDALEPEYDIIPSLTVQMRGKPAIKRDPRIL